MPAGAGIWLGVFGRKRGVAAADIVPALLGPGVMDLELAARDGVLSAGVEDGRRAVDWLFR